MPNERPTYTVLIASYLEPGHVERIRAVDERLRVVYTPELLPQPRYPADHVGKVAPRTPEQEAAWRALLAKADILFDFDYTNLTDLPDLAPNVRWVQASGAGIGQLVHRMGYAERMPNTVITTASGVHARPLSEFVIMVMLMFSRNIFRIQEQQARKHWERLAGTDLAGRTLGIIGMGHIGVDVARMSRPFGLRIVGTKRQIAGIDPRSLSLDELYSPPDLDKVLRQAEFLVLCAPHTYETENLIAARELALMPKGAVIINIARGAEINEPDMIEALRSGHLGGAALDVFAEEPLPVTSPLWDMPNVLISPHSASTSDRENERITNLFCANLRRFLNGEPLNNILDPERLY